MLDKVERNMVASLRPPLNCNLLPLIRPKVIRVAPARFVKADELTTSQVAARLGIGKSTVTLYCRQGRFPNAVEEDTPRGKLWWVPERDIEDFTPPTPGRPPKARPEATPASPTNGTRKRTATKAAAKGGKRGTKKPATTVINGE
jgi:hypothetical protein